MGNIGTPMTSGTIPAVGTSGTGYASTINAFLAEVKQRLEDRIPFSSFLVSALDMVNNAIQNSSYVGLYDNEILPATPIGSLQNYEGDLWWVSPSGAAQITSGDAVNSASIGGITGDYGGANPAQLRFVDADQTYYHYDDFAGGAWAFTRAQGVEITGGPTSLVRVRLDWGGSSSYTITLPTAAPASQAALQMEADGDIVASNTFPVAITVPRIITTESGDLTYPVYPNIVMTSGVGSISAASDVLSFTMPTGGSVGYIQIPQRKNQRISRIVLAGTATNEPTVSVIHQQGISPPASSATISTSSSGTLVSNNRKIITITSPTIYGEGEFLWLKIVTGSSTAVLHHIEVRSTDL
jgi:hypothetical protein